MPTAITSIARDHIEFFIADLPEHWKPATASNRYRALQSFLGWCIEEGEILMELDIPLETEAGPVLRDDKVGVFLSLSECVWLNIDGSLGRKH
ncbi:MAG: hypothetical protein QOH48_2482 [Actinomycetota bacterium]|jgi:hypothetical protein|nr:hypothetical protein [Actinomycetota bacterium]